MRLILILLLLSCSFSTFAQEESLFPELDELNYSKTTSDETVESQSNDIIIAESEESENSINKQDLFQKTEESVQDTVEPKPEENAKEEDDKDKYILWTIDNVNATITPNPVTSYCSASLGIFNMLGKELKEFSGSFTFGDMTKEFKFSNLAKEKASGYKYMFVGTACEQILNIPELNIKTCKVDGWSEKKCKEKVKYLQLGDNQATTR